MNPELVESTTCTTCGAKIPSTSEICEFCNSRISGSPSLFAGRAERVGFGWPEWTLPAVTVIWTITVGYGSFLIPRFYGWITFAACLAVAFTVLCRVEVLMTAARWLCIISALRSIVVMILIRMNFTFELYALYGIGLILSVLLAFMIYANED